MALKSMALRTFPSAGRVVASIRTKSLPDTPGGAQKRRAGESPIGYLAERRGATAPRRLDTREQRDIDTADEGLPTGGWIALHQPAQRDGHVASMVRMDGRLYLLIGASHDDLTLGQTFYG